MDVASLVRKNVLNLVPYSSARDEFSEVKNNMIFLDANENPFNNTLNRYPDPQQIKLKSKIAALKKVNTNQILLGNGSDEVLDLVFRVFCEPSVDNIIILPPTYGMYKVLANVNNILIKEVELTTDFQPKLNEIFKAVDKHTKIVFLCSPNNPSGNLIDSKIIEKLLQNFSGIVVLDEAYIDFADTESWLNKLTAYQNLIITQTFSKAYGMAGIRLGVCFASPQIISFLNKVKPPYNINTLTQNEALNQLTKFNEVQNKIATLQNERNKLSKALNSIVFITKVYPSKANFILVKVDDATKRYQQLLKKNIVVRNRSNQPLCANTLRFTVGTPKENLKLLNVLKDIEND